MNPVSVKMTGKDLPDTEIARRVALGDQDAFQLLMRRYNQTLICTARSILKDDAEAENAVQEAYMLAYRAIGAFRGDAKLSTWLIRIVVNEAIARSRKRSRCAEINQLSGDQEADADTTEENMNEGTPEQPEHAAVRAETRRLLETKIDALPEVFRTVFVLREGRQERFVGTGCKIGEYVPSCPQNQGAVSMILKQPLGLQSIYDACSGRPSPARTRVVPTCRNFHRHGQHHYARRIDDPPDG